MSTPFVRELRVRRLKDDIERFEMLTKTQGLFYALKLSWITTMIIYLTSYFFDFLFDRTDLPVFVAEYGFIKIIITWVFWFIIDYFWLVRNNHLELKKSKIELEKYLKKYPELEKSIP
jgi:hypothetical protein